MMPPSNTPRIVVLGAFPPPRTGQSVVTDVVSSALARKADVVRIDASQGMRAWRSGVRGASQRFLSWLRAIRDLRAAMNDGADIVYLTPAASRLGTLRDVVVLLVIGAGTRIVAHAHAGSMGAHLENSRVARWVAGRCDRILVPSEHAATSIRNAVPHADIRVAYNPIANELRFSRREVEGKWKRSVSDSPSILFLANMIPGKGYDELITAVSRLEAPVRVVLAGEWPDARERAQFERRLDALDLAERVHVTGALPIERVRSALMDATLLVHPSMMNESAGLVLVEAMAVGCGVVAYDHTGSGELVGDAGLLAMPGHIDALLEAIRRMLEDPVVWGKRARTRYEKFFDPESLESSVVEAILSVDSVP